MKSEITTLLSKKNVWLVTGAAGFIGSNLVECLLKNNQKVIGIDNLSTGTQSNLDFLIDLAANKNDNFDFKKVDIMSENIPEGVFEGVDYVLHQAALGSVPRSIKDPISSCNSNVSGFVNMMKKSLDSDIKSFVFASSSSVYGDVQALVKKEDNVGEPLSPYALTKKINEQYSTMFYKTNGFKSIGLRYFNVFGPRQNPDGAYSAVIPKWIKKMINNEPIEIYGDGETSRDFCFIENVINANLLAAIKTESLNNDFFNVAYGETTTLNELFEILKDCLASQGVVYTKKPTYCSFRQGDVKHSLADLEKSKSKLGYDGEISLRDGIKSTVKYYLENL